MGARGRLSLETCGAYKTVRFLCTGEKQLDRPQVGTELGAVRIYTATRISRVTLSSPIVRTCCSHEEAEEICDDHVAFSCCLGLFETVYHHGNMISDRSCTLHPLSDLTRWNVLPL